MYIDKYGLTNSKPDESGAENGLLWTLEHILLEEKKGSDQRARIALLKRSIEKCRVGQGLFMQNPSHVEFGVHHERDTYMSPDQLIAIMLISYREGWEFHHEIIDEIKRQKYFFYNNVKDKKVRLIHPRDLVLYYTVAYPILGAILLPLLAIACVVACMKSRPHTSGKLLAWVKIEMLKKDFLSMRLSGKICDLLIKRTHKSWSDVFSIYFPLKDHPINILAKEVYGDR